MIGSCGAASDTKIKDDPGRALASCAATVMTLDARPPRQRAIRKGHYWSVWERDGRRRQPGGREPQSRRGDGNAAARVVDAFVE